MITGMDTVQNQSSHKALVRLTPKRLAAILALHACAVMTYSEAMASKGPEGNRIGATAFAVKSSSPRGLKIANAQLVYNDGDALTGVFRVYCPTRTIRPTSYTLWSKYGKIKKQGAWWDPAFPPKWKPEYELVQTVCSSGDYGNL
jgi:hypothetical protein